MRSSFGIPVHSTFNLSALEIFGRIAGKDGAVFQQRELLISPGPDVGGQGVIVVPKTAFARWIIAQDASMSLLTG